VDLLSLVTFLPLFGAVALLLLPRSGHGVIRSITLFLSVVVFFLSIKVFMGFVTNPDMQFVKQLSWIPSLGITYTVGIDGLSLFLVLLVTFTMPIVILSSYKAVGERVKEFHVLMLLLETAMIGAFVSLDLFLFYVFWEMMLIPMYFLIGMWGGERKIYATIKFFIFTMIGSLLWRHVHSGWSFLPSRCPLRSRCRCSRSTHGCPMLTWRRRRPVVLSWQACC
jgi:NADH-quinone oxidoreductase subunit M